MMVIDWFMFICISMLDISVFECDLYYMVQ